MWPHLLTKATLQPSKDLLIDVSSQYIMVEIWFSCKPMVITFHIDYWVLNFLSLNTSSDLSESLVRMWNSVIFWIKGDYLDERRHLCFHDKMLNLECLKLWCTFSWIFNVWILMDYFEILLIGIINWEEFILIMSWGFFLKDKQMLKCGGIW